MSGRLQELRASGLSKRSAKRALHAKVSRHIPKPAPIREYRRLSQLKRIASNDCPPRPSPRKTTGANSTPTSQGA